MTALLNLWATEPIRVIGAVTAIIAVATVFGLPITADQGAKIVAAVAAVIVLLGGAEVGRSQVTPA